MNLEMKHLISFFRSTMKNYYEILNITPDVDEKEIYGSYRKKINQYNKQYYHFHKNLK